MLGNVNRAILSALMVGVATLAAVPADAQSDTKVAIVAGGPHPWFEPWGEAAAKVAEDRGIEATFRVPAAWDLGQQNAMIESLVGQGFNAVALFPGDASGTNAILGELSAFDIPSAAIGACTNEPTPALFCFGTDVYASAFQGAQEVIAAMGGQGNIAHFTGWLSDPNTQLRIDAVQAAADEVDGVEVIQVIADIDAPEIADEAISAFMAAQGNNVNGIITTAWMPSVAAAASLRAMDGEDIAMVGIDAAPALLEAIQDGIVDGTMSQNTYALAYIGAYALDLVRQGCTFRDDAPWLKTSQTTRFIDSGTQFVSGDEVADYDKLMREAAAEMQAGFAETYMDCPEG